MSNIQFYFAMGVPSILVILSWIQANSRSGDLKENMNRQFDSMNRRFEDVNRQFDAMNHRLDGVDRRLETIDGDLKHFHNVTGKLEGRVDELSNR